MVLTDELCDRLCAAAREKSKEIGIDISFAVYDESSISQIRRGAGAKHYPWARKSVYGCCHAMQDKRCCRRCC